MAKINLDAMSVAELVNLRKEISATISLRSQIESMQQRLNISSGMKIKVLSGTVKLIGKEFEVLNVGKTRVKFMYEGKEVLYPISMIEVIKPEKK